VSQPFNTIKVEKESVSGVPVNLATSFNSGDMMKWDPNNRIATPVVPSDAGSTTAALLFLGVSNDTNPINNLGQNLPTPRIKIVTRGIAQFTAADSATYYPGDAVTIGPDPQQIQHCGASGPRIGVVAPENFFAVTSGASVGIVAVSGVTTLLIALQPTMSAFPPSSSDLPGLTTI
jgi:hypothetical protein